MTLTGYAELTAVSGAAYAHSPGALGAARLQAEAATIQMEWERGFDIGSETSLAKYVTDRGNDTLRIDQVDAWFGEFAGTPMFLAFPDGGPMTDTAASPTSASLTPSQDVAVVSVGTAPGATRAGDPPDLGFWYVVQGPVVRSEGSTRVDVQGSFSLFVHNVTVQATGDGARWSNWTGYQESDANRPVTEFETRVTVIRVQNGTFSATVQDGLELFGASVEALMDGAVSAPGASGRLELRDKMLVYDDDPLLLDGFGTLGVAAVGSEAAFLRLEPSGEFEVRRVPGVQVAPRVEAADSLGPWFGPLAGIAMLAVVGGGLARSGVIPVPTPTSRSRRFAMWMRRGHQAAQSREWNRAAGCFEKATRAKRDEPLGWYEWACASLEAGEFARADEIVRAAGAIPGTDPLDLLDLRAGLAWHRGDIAGFEGLLGQLAKSAPAMARGLLEDLGVDAGQLGPPLAAVFGAGRVGGTQDGYA